MKKRLRKKLHCGEYAVFGFHVEFTTREQMIWFGPNNEDGLGYLFSQRLDEWAHERGWCLAPGGDGKRWTAFVEPDMRKQNAPHPGLTEKNKIEILNYLQSLPEVDQVVVSQLVNTYKDDETTWQEHCRKADEVFGSRS